MGETIKLEGRTIQINGGEFIGPVPTSWEEAHALTDKWNREFNDKYNVRLAPWGFDCGFKLSFDVPGWCDSRFYPPTVGYGDGWDGGISFTGGLEVDIHVSSLDELKRVVTHTFALYVS